MNFRNNNSTARCIGALMLFLAVAAGAQTPAPGTMPNHTATATSTPPAADSAETAQLQQELTNLRQQVRQLQQQVQASPSGMTAQNAPGMQKMGMDMDKGMEGEEDMDMPMADAPPDPGMGMEMDMMKRMKMMRPMMSDDGMMGMAAMGGTNSPVAMATPSALPGFPGQSHLYHIGATGFFLDHPEHITLTTEQKQALAQRKQQSLMKQGELQRQIDAVEQEMWQLTGADQPQIAEIEKKAREIERLKADQRIAFIRAVGEAGKLLNEQQRKQLTGTAAAQSPAQKPAAPPAKTMPKKDPAMSGMKDHM